MCWVGMIEESFSACNARWEGSLSVMAWNVSSQLWVVRVLWVGMVGWWGGAQEMRNDGEWIQVFCLRGQSA